MNKYYKYKDLYLKQKKMFGGMLSENNLIGSVNDKSIFHFLRTLDHGVFINSTAHIYWSDDFSPFTISHTKLIISAINNLIKSNSLITTVNVHLVPKFNSKCTNIKWTDTMALIKLVAKELKKLYQVLNGKVTINFFPSDFSKTINSSIYMYENFSSKPDLYLELELFCKLNTINPLQIYYVAKPDEIISIFTGIGQTNTIHLISKYNFISWNKNEPFTDLELINKNIGKEMDLAFLQTLPITTELLNLLFDQNVKNFKSKQINYKDKSLINYDDRRLDFFYENEVKLSGELNYMTMELTIEDINVKTNKLILFIFEEDLDLTSSMTRNGIKFINQNIYPSLINYIAAKNLYF